MTDHDSADDARVYDGAERELLRRALKASGLSARQAAAKMDISDTRLRHIVNGYQPAGQGQRIRVMAPADTLVRIATVLDVGADELEAAGRLDAAREMRARQREIAESGDDSTAVIEAIRDWSEDPVNYLAPDDALRFFDDSALLGEVQRRLHRLREHVRGEVKHGYWDASSGEGLITLPADEEGGDGNADDKGGPAPIAAVKELSALDDEMPAAAKTGDIEESGEFNT